MTKLIVLLISLFTCTILYSQVQIIDGLTTEPIPYVHVKLLDENKGTITNFNGYFDLDTLFTSVDSLSISCLGYESKIISVRNIEINKQIRLSPVSQKIDEVTIVRKKGKYKQVKLGISRKPATKSLFSGVSASNGTIKAVHIPNEHSVSGVLKSANIFITESGIPDAHFRLHIYSVSSLEIKPDKELTSTNIISSGTSGNEWIKVDLQDQRIIIPENGCFVGIEWFDSPKSAYFQDTLKNTGMRFINGKFEDSSYSHIRSGNGIVLGSRYQVYKEAKNKLWYKTQSSNDWINWRTTTKSEDNFNVPDTLPNGYIIVMNENIIHFKIPCVNIKVSFPKEKISTDMKPPKKNKLNKLERVKEDNYTYPQASVLELFNSIIHAVEKDEIIYILKYLCVYEDYELDSILETIEENKNTADTYFLPNEKERIIAQLNTLINNLKEQSLTKIDNHYFELKVNNDTYKLVVENGKWKINPYSNRIIQ